MLTRTQPATRPPLEWCLCVDALLENEDSVEGEGTDARGVKVSSGGCEREGSPGEGVLVAGTVKTSVAVGEGRLGLQLRLRQQRSVVTSQNTKAMNSQRVGREKGYERH